MESKRRGRDRRTKRLALVLAITLPVLALAYWPPTGTDDEQAQPRGRQDKSDVARSAMAVQASDRQAASAVSGAPGISTASDTGMSSAPSREGDSSTSVVNQFIGQLSGERPFAEREVAARALMDIGSSRAIAALVDAARSERDIDRRRALVSALHHLREPAAAPALIDALKETDDPVLFIVIRDVLARIADDRAATALVSSYQTASEGWQQWNLLGALLRIRRPEAVPGLTHVLLHSRDHAVVLQAAIALAQIGTQDAVEALVAGIERAPTMSAAQSAELSLEGVTEREAVAGLTDALMRSPSHTARAAAARALGNIPTATSAAALAQALDTESDSDVRRSIEFALTRVARR